MVLGEQFTGEPISDPGVREWERTYAMFTHLTAVVAAWLIPVVPALIMWQIKKHESSFIDDHGREAVNFQLTLLVYMIAGMILTVVCIGLPMIVGVYALGLVGMILAAVRAHAGQFYRYPMCIRFIRPAGA